MPKQPTNPVHVAARLLGLCTPYGKDRILFDFTRKFVFSDFQMDPPIRSATRTRRSALARAPVAPGGQHVFAFQSNESESASQRCLDAYLAPHLTYLRKLTRPCVSTRPPAPLSLTLSPKLLPAKAKQMVRLLAATVRGRGDQSAAMRVLKRTSGVPQRGPPHDAPGPSPPPPHIGLVLRRRGQNPRSPPRSP